MLTIKEMVSNDKKVRFMFYRDQALHYQTEDGFVFPVPIHDAGSATFGAQEKAMLMMRYIRKHIETIEMVRKTQNSY
jgi:hypothetical protein